MRIGMLAPPWVPVPPAGYGGTETIVDALTRGLAAAGHDPVLFATGDSTCDVTRLWLFDEPPSIMGQAMPELQHVQAAYDALADCDVIHDHTLVGPIWAAAREVRVPVISTVHGDLGPGPRALYGQMARWASLTAISQSQRASAPEVPFAAVVLHGIDASRFPVGNGDGGYALFVGRFSPDKGAHEAIEIARKAGIPLRIAAKMREPAERAYFAESIEPELGPDVEYLGELTPDERNEELARATVLLNPIQWMEPFGLVMVEAMACGTPVIAYPNGAAPEIVKHGTTGFLCDDADSAAEALRHIGEIDRSACRKTIESEFSAARMAHDYIAVYRRVVERARESHAR
jgi:glycosyltransferase involved in cell wall biosynthesis